MTKLVLEEGGRRREFKVGDGRLTVGSGEAAKLRLSSPDVAGEHFELVIEGDVARVVPRPGVVAPRISGVPVEGAGELRPGGVLQLGAVRLWLETEGGAQAAQPPAYPVAPRPRAVVARRRARKERGVPTGLIVVLVLVGAGIAVAVVASVLRRQGELGAGPVWASIQAAEQQLEQSNFDLAELKLDSIPEAREVTPQERARVAELREEIARRRADAALAAENLVGQKYFDVLLKNYEARQLAGSPEPYKVRLFLLRCREFRERWPRHPELDWVDRQEARFAGYVDLSAPPTWDDVAWEIKYVTGMKPRNYAHVFALLEEFMSRARGEELLEAEQLRQELVAERAEYHRDRIYQAEYEYNKKNNPNGAVWWLLHSVIWLGDEEMADEAAAFLVKIPDLELYLLGYREEYPDRFQAVLEHPLVAAWAREHGLAP